MFPNFFVLGTQKGGTTTLQNLLASHPEIYLPEQKETKFFARDREWQKGFEYYIEKYYSNVTTEKAIGEIDPDYMYYAPSLERMLKTFDEFSNIKLIFILRNPIERAFSHYLMSLRRGHEQLKFEDALATEQRRLETADFDEKMHFSYMDRSHYLPQIERYLQHTSRENILVLFTEELESDPAATLKKIFHFLNVDEDYVPVDVNQRHHKATKPRFLGLRHFLDSSGWLKLSFRAVFPFVSLRQNFKRTLLSWNETGEYTEKPVIDAETRTQLAKELEPDIQNLAEFCGKNLDHWQ